MPVLRLVAGIAGAAAALAAGLYAFAVWQPSGETGAALFPAARLAFVCADDPGCEPGLAARAGVHAPLGAPALGQRLTTAHLSAEPGERAALARLVLSQDARSELARVILAEEAYAAGDHEAFLSLYLPLFDTDRRQTAVYADVLAALSADRELFARLAPRVQQARPHWGGAYLAAVAGKGGVPVSGLVGLYTEFPAAQRGLLSQLTRSGNWAGAYILFSEFITRGALAGAAPPLTVPYNPELVRTDAPQPFNWQVRRQGAEWLEGGGVYAFFQGRKGETFLTQTFPLGAGSWRLLARLSGEVSETGGWYRWHLTCAGGGPALLVFDVQRLGSAPVAHEFGFEKPAGACEFVTLALIGVPGTFPQPARIEVAEVRLLPGQAGEGAP